MGEASKIEWCNSTFNTHWGCTRVSPGCENCYAETFSKRVGLKVWGQNADRRLFGDAHWNEPLKWNAKAQKSGEPWRVFCGSMMDYAEDRRDLDPLRARLARLVEATPFLTWLLLTKRPQNAVPLMRDAGWAGAWPANVLAMTTAEDQRRADERIPELLSIPTRLHGVSYEPAIGEVTFEEEWLYGSIRGGASLDWIIVGGESGPGARPFDLAWARSVSEQCKVAGVAYFFKQAGNNIMVAGERAAFRLTGKGGDIHELRAARDGDDDMLRREFPRGAS